ncbi:MAG: PepSY domain-containing protein [Flavobacteriaceae bacterium]
MYKTQLKIRKAHRYLGLIIGVQFLAWTISGLYFSWTDIDQIHGDPFLQLEKPPEAYANLTGLDQIEEPIHSIDLVPIGTEPYFWVNDQFLVNATTGERRAGISEEEARSVAAAHVIPELKIKDVSLLESTDAHHEYRGGPLPAYVISYDHPEDIKAYIAVNSGAFMKIRHRNWRWFDFLWMSHTMDYQGRDDFNNLLLRVFSLFGVLTVMSGFLLWGYSSPTLRKWRQGRR